MENNGHEPLKRQSKYCVGIGASAGGVEALQELFRNMPVDTGASFIVVQHLSPDSVSMMDQILQKSVKMPVRLAEEDMELRPNEIYLNVPGMLLEVAEGRLHLKPVKDRLQRYTPINQMLNSLASENDIHTIAVILSGSGSDGTIGIGSVKEHGGIIIVQKPLEAQYASMPQSALSTGLVDLTEKVSKIGLAIRDYLKNPNIQYIHHEDGIEDEEMGRYFDQVIDVVTRYSDIDFTAYKPNTIFRRIERRIAINKFTGIEEYIDHLLSSEEEKRLLCSDLLIGVTSFFRDEAAFKSLGEQVLAVLLRAKRSVRIWSIACSTGEEAYSLAIMVCEYMERLKCNVDVKIFATDMDPDAIAVAQKGFYSEGNLSDVNEDIIEKYFDKKEGGYVVKDLIRKMIVFAKHNIFRDAPFSRLDLITCRNMFIYVKTEVQQRAIENFYHLLNEGGYLFLGSSESLGDMEKAFDALDRKWKVFIKKKGYHTENNGFYLWDNLYHPQQTTNPPSAGQRSKVQTANIFEKILFAFAGPSVLVDGFGKIVQIIQGGGRYLSLQDGTFDNSIGSCFAPSLAILLNHIMEELKEAGYSVIERSVTGIADYPNECLKIKINYFNIEGEDYYLIQIGIGQMVKSEPAGGISLDISELKNSRISQLEKELGESNWKLSLAMEESESRNEELQATNEELMASNEELQSTNEEMQSINEELYTINAEHQSKIVELTTAYTDFDNLLVNAEVGALYVDRDMKIRKITPIMLQNTNLLPADLGRPVYHINRSSLHLQQLVSDVLDLSKIESGKMDLDMGPVDLKLLLSDVIGEFDALAKEKGVGLTQAGKLLHRYVKTDKVKLHEILANLTGNALKFVDSSGIVLLNIEEAAMTGGEAKFTFQVQDNGKGISEEDQERIFEAFDQGSHDKLYGNSGSGLGLTICKNLVEMLGGELKVESIEGAGTEFFFTLTMEILDEDKKQEVLPMCDARYKGLRVMVAEDNLINGEIAETLLRSFGFEVDLVQNGREAVDKFMGSPGGTYSMVLMDIQMPVMNGYDAARQIRDCGHADAKNIPILAMSANAFQEDIARSLDSGMNEHLSKPIDMEKLFHSISYYMD